VRHVDYESTDYESHLYVLSLVVGADKHLPDFYTYSINRGGYD
jgi:hypothetical protein